VKNIHRFALALSTLVVAAGCTPRERFGNEAFYSPSHHAYVIAKDKLHGRPDRGAETIVLADPLSGIKISCRKDLDAWLEPMLRVTGERVTKDNVDAIAGSLLAPLIVAGATVAALGMGVAAYGLLPGELAVANPDDRRRSGEHLLKEKHWGDARNDLELALVGAPGLAVSTDLLHSLGVAYEELGERDLAKRAFIGFLTRSRARAEEKYADAEKRLGKMGIVQRPCAKESIHLDW